MNAPTATVVASGNYSAFQMSRTYGYQCIALQITRATAMNGSTRQAN
jgi:hypothetical protein